MPRPAQACDDPLMHLARKPQTDEQNYNRADDIQRMADDQR
jgi:hypothetical protein